MKLNQNENSLKNYISAKIMNWHEKNKFLMTG